MRLPTKRESLLVLGAALVLAAGLIFGEEESAPAAQEPSPARTVRAAVARAPAAGKAKPARIICDPFEPANLDRRAGSSAAPPPPPAALAPAQPDLPALRGVCLDGERRLAIFEGCVAAEGEPIGAGVIEAIRSDGVVLRFQDGPLLLPLPAR